MDNPFGEGSSELEDNEELEQREEDEEMSVGGGHSVSYGEVAAKLLHDKLLLTALELHAELTEAGKQLPLLTQFFSNPENFEHQSKSELTPCIPRSSSQATLDSLDLTRFSEDGERGIIDERVAVLEFELRKAKETITSLRANLTLAATANTEIEMSFSSSPTGKTKNKSSLNEPIKPHELRALNFLINEYLLLRGYKLTSITFADENEDQDFEDWDDVGLNMSKPAELLQLYRLGMRHSLGRLVQTSESSMQTEEKEPSPGPLSEVSLVEQVKESKELKERVESLESTNRELMATLNSFKKLDEEHHQIVTTFDVETQSEINGEIWSGTKVNEDLNHHDSVEGPLRNIYETSKEGTKLRVSETITIEQAMVAPILDESVESVEAVTAVVDETIEEECSDMNDTVSLDMASEESSSVGRFVSAAATPPVQNDKITTDSKNLPENILFSSGFEREVWLEVSSPILELNLLDSITYEKTILLLAQMLSQYSRALIACKNESFEDVVSLLVCSVHLHPEPTKQEALLNFLLNIKKKPQEDERNLILSGIVRLASSSGEDVDSTRLLSQFWELMTHKYPEKRLLVAQATAFVAPYIPNELRDSLLVSMLQQLLDDREDIVRIACVRSLAVITAVISDPDKYGQIEELTLKCLADSSDNVVDPTVKLLLPVLARWATNLDKFSSNLVTSLITATRKYMKDSKDSKWVRTLRGLTSLLPYVVMYAAGPAPSQLEGMQTSDSSTSQLPPAQLRPGFADLCRGLFNPLLFYKSKQYTVGVVMSSFDYCIANNMFWPQIDWVLNSMLPSLLDMCGSVDCTHEEGVVTFIKFFRSFCFGFGTALALNKVKVMFIERLQKLEAELMIVNRDWPSTSIVPIYLLALLAPNKSEEAEVGRTLEKFLIALALCGAPLLSLKFTVRELCKQPHLADTVMSSIWQGVVHQRSSVRSATVHLLSEAVLSSPEQFIVTHILPALITLASDPEMSVRALTVPVFGSIIEHSSNKEVLDKTYLQIQSIVCDTALRDHHPTLINVICALSKMAPHCDPTFREEVVVGELSTFVGFTMDQPAGSKKVELAGALVEGYSNAVYCQLSKQNITNILLPALRLLENICNESLQTHVDTVSSMIREVESRIDIPSKQPSMQRSSSSQLVASPTNVEEMKQRVSKIIFNNPMAKSTHLTNALPNLFKKK